MGLLTEVLLLPLAPVRGVLWVAQCVSDEAERQLHSPDAVRRQLVELNRALTEGEIDEATFEREEERLLDLLERRQADRPMRPAHPTTHPWLSAIHRPQPSTARERADEREQRAYDEDCRPRNDDEGHEDAEDTADDARRPRRRVMATGMETWDAAPRSVQQGTTTTNLADLLERVLDKGIVIAGDIKIDLLDIELLTIRLRLFVASVDTAKKAGIDWWETDPALSSKAARSALAEENEQLRARLRELEPADEADERPALRRTGR